MKTGPSWNSKFAVRASYTSEPVMSPGIRSGVNCTRFESSESAAARDADQQRLRDSRYAFEQDVALAQQRDHQAGHDGVLADDRLGHLGAQRRQRLERVLGRDLGGAPWCPSPAGGRDRHC